MAEVEFVASDGERYSVPMAVAKQSRLVEGMLEGAGAEKEEVPLPDVKAAVLARIIEFLKYSHEHPMPAIQKPLKSSNLSDLVPDAWYVRFVEKLSMEDTFDLILAANYMDCPALLDLVCGKLACQVKGKSPAEVRTLFGIVNDFTPEEEAYAMEEYKLLMEAKD